MARLATLQISHPSLLPQPRGLCLRTLYFRDGQLIVGLTARMSNEHLAQKFQLNSTENGPYGNTANFASVSITPAQRFMLKNTIF
jgi:hypothetical protein